MDLGFGGEVSRFYQKYRRGYPVAVIDAITAAFDLDAGDVAVDLGCGTGQLTLPLAARLRAVVGVDPEPDMLALARDAATRAGRRNVTWVSGTDADLPAIDTLLGPASIGVVTAATALHWMNPPDLFRSTAAAVRPGGGFAVVTNGKPIWQLDAPWSHALRGFLDARSGRSDSAGCGTDDEAQQRYRDQLAEAGLAVTEALVEYVADMDLDHLVGALLSAFPVRDLPPPDARAKFTADVRAALGDGPYPEHVKVGLIFGRRP